MLETRIAWLTIGLAVVLATWGTYGPLGPAVAGESGTATAPARMGALAPNFSVPSLQQDEPLRLEDFRGKPVLINFWATWCPPCRTEMPEFQRFHEQVVGGAVVLGIDLQEDPATVAAFLRQHGITYRIGLDTDGRMNSAYGVTGLPTTVFVDAAGFVRDRVVGPLTYDGLVQRTNRLP